ncbi:MAG: WG repeat-containing protein [Bacilli bacterium]|nr:WG repeat-containing protein [Bacilli bacterium]
MLQIIEGQVEYLGRNDYRVKYTTVGDTQYFITEELPNGKYIVAKQLIDAILKTAISNGAFKAKGEEPEKEIPIPTSFGVIDENGTEIIPCQYKSVKGVGNDYYAIEPVELVSDSVKERANLAKEDPNNQIFVTTNSSVTEKMYAKMGSAVTEFVFRDQCSEATICDAQGNNVINDEYASYIAYNENGVFFSNNTIGSPIKEFDFNTKTVVNLDQQTAEQTTEQVVAAPQVPVVEQGEVAQAPTVEAESAEVPQEETLQPQVPVEGVAQEAPEAAPEAVTEEVASEETLQPQVPVEGVAQEAQEVAPEAVTEEVTTEETLQPQVPVEGVAQEAQEVTPEAVTEEVAPEVGSLETTPEAETTEEVVAEEVQPETAEETVTEEVATEEAPQEEVTEEVTEEVSEEETPEAEEEVEETLTNDEEEVTDEVDNTEDEIDVSDVEVDKEEIEDAINEEDTLNIEDSESKDDTEDFKIDLDDYSTDTKYNFDLDSDLDSNYDYSEENYYDSEDTREKSILAPAAVAMNNLIKEVKTQKYNNEKLTNMNESLKEKNSLLEDRYKKLESHRRVIEKENAQLKEKLHDQARIIDKQDRKIIAINKERVDSIERQRKSEEDLAKLVQLAYGELNSNTKDSYSYGSRKIAA